MLSSFSIVVEMEGAGSIEVATVGAEGMAGLPVFLGAGGQVPLRGACPGDPEDGVDEVAILLGNLAMLAWLPR